MNAQPRTTATRPTSTPTRASLVDLRVFGADLIDDAVRRICKVLADWGYRRDAAELAAVICQMLLLNRSPLLEDLSTEALAALRVHPAMSGRWGKDLYGLHRAVAALGHADPLPSGHEAGPAAMEGVPAPWAASVEHWYAPSTLTPKIRRDYRSVLAKIGRWLAAEHPEITGPSQWTRQTCASWVAAVDRMAVGDFSQWTHGMRSQNRLGNRSRRRRSPTTSKCPARSSATCTNGS